MDEIDANKKLEDQMRKSKLSPKEVSIKLNITNSKQKSVSSHLTSSVYIKNDN